MDPPIELQLETMHLERQEQPLIVADPFTDDDINKILANTDLSEDLVNQILDASDSNDISALINSASNDYFGDESVPNMDDLFSSGFDSTREEHTHNISLQQNDPQDYSHQSLYLTGIPSEYIGSSPVDSTDNQNTNDVQAYINRQNQLLKTAKVSKTRRTYQQRATTVQPVNYMPHSVGYQPYSADQMQENYAYQEQLAEYNTVKGEKIQIISQPRPNFRPRTQNESKNSSHYLRCEEGVKPDYPTISIPQQWHFNADVNLIEVALVGLDEQPHPYSITNKQCSETFEDGVLIFRNKDPSILYFVITKEDFYNGYKTFMIELIKGKQGEHITKKLIRERNLEQSKLRFTRFFQVTKGNFQRDDESVEYSSVMSETYGDVEVEHMGPRYGPMGGQEMVYAVLKGRILKTDLKIEVIDYSIGWCYPVENFTKNGNVLYFPMPPNPNPFMLDSMTANIMVYHKGEEIHQTTYLYKGSLDEDLAALRLNDQCPTTTTSSMTHSFDIFDFSSATGAGFPSSSSRTSTTKRAKRLDKKPRGPGDRK